MQSLIRIPPVAGTGVPLNEHVTGRSELVESERAMVVRRSVRLPLAVRNFLSGHSWTDDLKVALGLRRLFPEYFLDIWPLRRRIQ